MLVGVIGSGTIGKGIAQVFAENQYEVILCSSSKESASAGKRAIEAFLKKKVAKGKITCEEANAALTRIVVGEYEDCKECKLIVEAVPESLELKKEVFRKLDRICNDTCVFASNTSSLSISEISKGLKRQIVGMHFFNPAQVMKLVEVIVSDNAKPEDIELTKKVAKELKKTPVVVKETPGFVVNRILIPMINTAAGLYADGIASAEDIDTAMHLGANHPMGPLRLADLIGIDVVNSIMVTLNESLNDDSCKPNHIFSEMINKGELGQKTGKGFYIYGEEKK